MMKKLTITFIFLVFFQVSFATTDALPTSCTSELLVKAEANGLSLSTIKPIISSLKHLPKVIEYDRSQPEFSQTFSNYVTKRVTTYRINLGKELLKKHHRFLDSLYRQYGVPGRYLIAFWGLETNFGQYMGKMPTLDSLATLACDQRRSEFFTKEFILALKLLERESLNIHDMKGSWAGAMGHTQFMPSTYERYAIDGDNDGQIDLFNSIKDALASGANYLHQLGWKGEDRWGREVFLPKDFGYEESGLKKWHSLSDWKKLGVTKANGYLLPELDMKAALLVPSGHKGPTFLVYKNFDTILNWNRSNYYALSIGLLADRISNRAGLKKALVVQQPLNFEKVKIMQESLNNNGFNVGKADGIMGSKTKQAIQLFQRSKGLIADGYPYEETLSLLLKTLQ